MPVILALGSQSREIITVCTMYEPGLHETLSRHTGKERDFLPHTNPLYIPVVKSTSKNYGDSILMSRYVEININGGLMAVEYMLNKRKALGPNPRTI